MKKVLTIFLVLSLSMVTCISAFATTSEPADKYIYSDDEIVIEEGEKLNIESGSDDSFKIPEFSTYQDQYEGGGSYSTPIKIGSAVLDMYGIPLEYSVVNGQFMFFPRPDLYYYQQNATVSYLDNVTGTIAQSLGNALGTYVTYALGSKIPYIARLFNANGQKPYTWGDYALGASSYMVQNNIPLWNKIINTPVPSAGTKTVIVYISTNNSDWERRVNFTITKDGTITYTKWWVNP